MRWNGELPLPGYPYSTKAKNRRLLVFNAGVESHRAPVCAKGVFEMKRLTMEELSRILGGTDSGMSPIDDDEDPDGTPSP